MVDRSNILRYGNRTKREGVQKMNANVTESASRTGKLIAILVAALFVFSSISLLVPSGSADEQDSEVTEGIYLGEALMSESEGHVEAISELNTILPGQDVPWSTTMADGKFSPEKQEAGAAKVLVVDDDGENWMSGPWLEASHIATALNDVVIHTMFSVQEDGVE